MALVMLFGLQARSRPRKSAKIFFANRHSERIGVKLRTMTSTVSEHISGEDTIANVVNFFGNSVRNDKVAA